MEEANYQAFTIKSLEKAVQKKNTQKFFIAIMNLRILINIFYKKHLKKHTIIFLPLNSVFLMIKPIILPIEAKLLIKPK